MMLNSTSVIADGTSVSAQHLHLHMHMHAHPLYPLGMTDGACDAPHSRIVHPSTSSQSANSQHSTLQQQSHPEKGYVGSSTSNASEQHCLHSSAYTTQSSIQEGCCCNVHSKHQSYPAEATCSTSQQQKRARNKRIRSVLRALMATGAATAVVLAGAGTAVAVLAPRIEQLESRCSEVADRNKQLGQQTSDLEAAKQMLQQQLNALKITKEHLDQRIHTLSQQQDGLSADNARLQSQVNALHDNQQQLQHATDELRAEVTLTHSKLQEQQQQPLQQQASAAQCAAVSGPTAQPGDLSVQVTVPGFTETLVTHVGDAELVPQFAQALVTHVKESGLVQHTVEGLVSRAGQAVSEALCPWKWNVPLPWQRRAKHVEGASNGV